MHIKVLKSSTQYESRRNQAVTNVCYFDFYLLFFCTSAEGCTIYVCTKWMMPSFLNTIAKSIFFVQVNIEPVVRVCSNDTDAFVILVSCLQQLNCKSLHLNWSTEEHDSLLVSQLTFIACSLGDEKVKAFPEFHVLTCCDTIEQLISKSKEV